MRFPFQAATAACAGLLAFAWPAHAADPVPEIQRSVAKAQAIGAVHTLRTIPEACARLQGTFSNPLDHGFAVNVG